jgi:hypothetical protein
MNSTYEHSAKTSYVKLGCITVNLPKLYHDLQSLSDGSRLKIDFRGRISLRRQPAYVGQVMQCRTSDLTLSPDKSGDFRKLMHRS